MAYQALYRKFRPQDFNEVSGQEHIVQTLKNQLNSGRIGHAYVFSGTRGTGKTTVAKIFAKALNCENLVDGNPCNECASCRKINDGASLNVHEIDGASNNGVDHVRQLIEDVSYPPVEGKSKVYIIDEAHMVTQQAFNALLKTIEEPPAYAIFILATTEVNKIPITILSRCQRYDFHRITVDKIALRMQELREAEKFSIDDRAIKYIARLADGSLRDALSIYDQCISYYYGQDITYDMTLEMLGTADTEVFSKLFRAINNHDAKSAIDITGEAIIRGMEPETFVSDFTWYLRNLLLVKNGERLEDVADISSEDAKSFMEEVDIAEDEFIMRCITVMSELLNELKFSTVKRVCLETGVIRLCRPQMDNDYGALLDRIRALESGMPTEASIDFHVADEVVSRPIARPKEQIQKASVQPALEPEPEETYEKPQVVPATFESEPIAPIEGGLESVWGDILDVIPQPDKSMTMKAVVIDESEDTSNIFFEKKSVGGGFYSKPENVQKLKDRIISYMGREITVNINIVEDGQIPTPKKMEKTESASDSFFKNAEKFGVVVEIEDT